jgi:hypothetical protein
VALENFYGRLSIPDTFRVLGPGEAASVKVRDPLVFYSPALGESSGRNLDLPQRFVVTATLDLDDTSLANPYATVNSKNHVKLTVARASETRK